MAGRVCAWEGCARVRGWLCCLCLGGGRVCVLCVFLSGGARVCAWEGAMWGGVFTCMRDRSKASGLGLGPGFLARARTPFSQPPPPPQSTLVASGVVILVVGVIGTLAWFCFGYYCELICLVQVMFYTGASGC